MLATVANPDLDQVFEIRSNPDLDQVCEMWSDPGFKIWSDPDPV